MSDDDSNGKEKVPKRKHVGPYELGATIGEGTFGRVKLGTHIFTGDKVAIKEVKNKNVNSERERQQLEREKKILQILDHPNIVQLHKSVDDQKRQVTYMIFEFISGGELFDYIVSHGRLSEDDARRFFRDIVSAVEYCHYNLIIHRDLKPENLLLDENLNIKISDFGLANIMKPGKKFSTFCGSLHYACPEILRGHKYIGPGVDIWSMGVILYCLVVGRQPWDAETAEQMYDKILSEGIEIPDWVSDDCVDIILKMLRVNEADRIPLSDMKTHPFVMKGYSHPPKCVLPSHGAVTQIDDEIIRQLVQIGFEDTPELRAQLVQGGNSKTQEIATYHLLWKKKLDAIKRAKDRKKKKKMKHYTVRGAEADKSKLKPEKSGEKTPKRNSYNNNKEKGKAKGPSPREPKAKTSRERSSSTSSKQRDRRVAYSDDEQSGGKSKSRPVVGLDALQKAVDKRAAAGPQIHLRAHNHHDVASPRPRRTVVDFFEERSESSEEVPKKKQKKKNTALYDCTITSPKALPDIQKELLRVLKKEESDIAVKPLGPHKWRCTSNSHEVRFTVAIVSVEKYKNLRGIKFARIYGDVWIYKDIYERITSKLKI